jgi:hypothetical protein
LILITNRITDKAKAEVDIKTTSAFYFYFELRSIIPTKPVKQIPHHGKMWEIFVGFAHTHDLFKGRPNFYNLLDKALC